MVMYLAVVKEGVQKLLGPLQWIQNLSYWMSLLQE